MIISDETIVLFGIITNLSSRSKTLVERTPIDTTVPIVSPISTRSPTSKGLSTANRNEFAILLMVCCIAIPSISAINVNDANIPNKSISSSIRAKYDPTKYIAARVQITRNGFPPETVTASFFWNCSRMTGIRYFVETLAIEVAIKMYVAPK